MTSEEHYEVRDRDDLSRGTKQIVYVGPDGKAKTVGASLSEQRLELLRQALNQHAEADTEN
jgi:hypothetical protein